MALLHFDGFEEYLNVSNTAVSPYLNGAYITTGSSSSVLRPQTMPELGSTGLQSQNGVNSGSRFRWVFPTGNSTSRTFGFGFHIYVVSANTNGYIATLEDASGTQRYAIAFTPGGVISLRSGTGTGTEIASASGFNTSTLYHIECKIVQHASTGSIEIRVNGATVILLSSINTAAQIGSIGFSRFGLTSGSYNMYWDNLYIWDNTGSENNDWLGERLVYTLMPDGDGATQDWTLSTGSDTYALLDNIPSDPDNQYIESSAVDDIAQVTMSDLPSMDIIPIGVKTIFRGMKTGTSSIEVGVAPSGETPVGHPLTQDQSLYFGNIYETNPDTGQPWTPSEINALTLDIKRVL